MPADSFFFVEFDDGDDSFLIVECDGDILGIIMTQELFETNSLGE